MAEENANRNQVMSASENEQASRQLMDFLYGDQAEAIGKALLRSITPEELKIVEQRYNAGDKIARETARGADVESFSKSETVLEQEFAPLTAAEETEFDSFMREVYRRAEVSEQNEKTKMQQGAFLVKELGDVVARMTSMADAVGEWLSLPFKALSTIDLAFGKPALAPIETSKGGEVHKVGKSISFADLNSTNSQLAKSGWRSAEVRLILSINSLHEIYDVSVKARGADLNKLTEETLDVRLRDHRGNERAFVLSRDRMQGYMTGNSLVGDVTELELLIHVSNPAS